MLLAGETKNMLGDVGKMAVTKQAIDAVLVDLAAKTNVDVTVLETDTDLFAAGLDSISLMNLVGHWRAAGYDVDFASLARTPELGAWAEYLAAAQSTARAASDGRLGLGGQEVTPQTQPVGAAGAFPLAPMQYAYWLGRDPKQPLGGVAAHLYVEFHRQGGHEQVGVQVDPERLAVAVERLVARHSCLRMKVLPDGQQTHLPVGQGAELQTHDLRPLSAADAEVALQDSRQRFASQMLDIEAGQVMAIAISVLPDGSCRLHLDVDFIAVDAISYRILLRELAVLYEDPQVELPPLPVSYRDFRLASERQWETVKQGSGRWWQERLSELPEGPQLPLKQPLTGVHRTTRRHFHFDGALRAALYTRCRKHGLTPSVVLATVLAETLAGWSREPRFLLNIPLFLRPQDKGDVSGVVGDFSSSVMLAVDMGPDESFAARAKGVQSRLHEDAARADYGGVQVLRDLGRQRARQITVPVVFTSGLNLGELFDPAVRRVFGDPVWIISQGPQVLLDAQVTELDGGLLVNWDCREDAFLDGVLDAMFSFFQSSVQALANSADAWDLCLAAALPAARVRPLGAARGDLPGAGELPPEAPRTPLEAAVGAIWREVLGRGGTNVHQNLFADGGDSLLAGTLVAQLREVFGASAVDLQKLFAAPTIAGLAEAIVAEGDAEQMTHIATVYCEIMELDDAAIMAEAAY